MNRRDFLKASVVGSAMISVSDEFIEKLRKESIPNFFTIQRSLDLNDYNCITNFFEKDEKYHIFINDFKNSSESLKYLVRELSCSILNQAPFYGAIDNFGNPEFIVIKTFKNFICEEIKVFDKFCVKSMNFGELDINSDKTSIELVLQEI